MASQDSPKTPETSPGGGAGGAHWEKDENGDYVLVADAESGSSGGPGGIPLGPLLGGAGAGAAAGTVAGTVLGNSNSYPDVPGTPPPPSQSQSSKTLLGIPTSVWGDILGGVIGLAGTKIATNASGDASRAQLEALDRATALQREMYQQSRSDQLPWLKAGTGALSMLSHGLGLPSVDLPTVGTNGLPQTPKQNPVNAQNPQGFQISPDGQTGTGNFSLRQLQGLPPSTSTRSGNVASPPTQSLNGSMGSALQPVTMRTPTGSIIQVPQNMVAEATAKGAVPA